MSDMTLAPRRRPLWRLFIMPVLLADRRRGVERVLVLCRLPGRREGRCLARAEAKSGRVYDCAKRSVAGFPFRLEVRCDGASVSLVSQTAGQAATQAPITAKLGEILVVAQVYDPKLLIAEFTAPATISDRGEPPSMIVNWSKARSSVVGLPAFRSAPPSCSTIPRSIASTARCRRRWRAPNMSNCTAGSPKARRRIIP